MSRAETNFEQMLAHSGGEPCEALLPESTLRALGQQAIEAGDLVVEGFSFLLALKDPQNIRFVFDQIAFHLCTSFNGMSTDTTPFVPRFTPTGERWAMWPR